MLFRSSTCMSLTYLMSNHMPLFSQRKGLTPLRTALQVDDIDTPLRNRLWSALHFGLWRHWSPRDMSGYQCPDAQEVERIVDRLWVKYFRLPFDTRPRFEPGTAGSAYEQIRKHFFEDKWFMVYDLIESVIQCVPDELSEQLKHLVNEAMEEENGGYRLVGTEIVGIVDPAECESVESALSNGPPPSTQHLTRALELLSDRVQPDYRNSVKESISAVESVCQTLAKKSGATLGDCIASIKGLTAMHPAFEKAIKQLYGYTSDEGGIRHALTEQSSLPTFADAKFMLVACSALINFLLAKAAEQGR